jgi:hypothetical protein
VHPHSFVLNIDQSECIRPSITKLTSLLNRAEGDILLLNFQIIIYNGLHEYENCRYNKKIDCI